MCPSPIQKDSQLDSSDREQPNRPNSVLRTGTSLKVTKAKTSYTTAQSSKFIWYYHRSIGCSFFWSDDS